MIPGHEEYELHCALAVAGQLTASECGDLEQHAASCPACRAYLADLAVISREIVLAQAAIFKPIVTPAGMQQRFVARACAAGIPLRRSEPASLYPQALRAAAIAVLLAMSLSITWRFFSAHSSDAKPSPGTLAAQSEPAPIVVNSAAPIAEAHPFQNKSLQRSQFTRKSASPQHSGSNSSSPAPAEPRHPYLDLDQPSFAQPASPLSSIWSARLAENPLAAGLLASARTSFPQPNSAPCFGIGDEGKPEERPCHLEIKLASLSCLDDPRSPGAASGLAAFRLSPPVFHLAPNSAQ
jgi:hypothetical protein